MNLLIGLSVLVLSRVSLGSNFVNNSEIELLNQDYFRDEFLVSASRIQTFPNISLCDLQLVYINKNWRKRNVFPLIDSWGKLPSGLMKGHLFAIGNYDECLNLKTGLPIPFGTLEGQYCKGMFQIMDLDPSQQTRNLENRMNSNTQSRENSYKLYIKSGVCIPKSCSAVDLEKKLPFLLRDCEVKESIPLKPIDYVTISLLSVIAFLLILGTAYDYLYKGSNKNPFLMAFSVPSNAEKLFQISLSKKKNNIDCLNGIRVLSMVWVIYGHTSLSNLRAPLINWFDLAKWSRTFFSMFTHNAYISVDSFFFISGLLLSWIGMKEIVKKGGRINVPLMYLHRYLRLTPMVGFIMLFVLSLLKFLGSGPQWKEAVESAALGCSNNWWMNFLYIQNYAREDICLGQTWYLAIDFQLFLLSPLILYGFWKCGKKFIIVVAVLVALSVGCIYGIFYSKGFSSALVINDKEGAERMVTYYRYAHTRYSIWLIGMAFGYLLYESKDKTINIPWYIQVLGWSATAAIIYGVIVAPYSTIQANFQSNNSAFEGASYEAFSKIGWGLMMSWIVFACYHGYGGVVNSFLSNPAWQPFARLSFAMYMSHMTIMSVNIGNMRTEAYFSDFTMILQFWSHFGITVLVSMGLVLTIESPMIGLEKMLLQKRRHKIEVLNDGKKTSTDCVDIEETGNNVV